MEDGFVSVSPRPWFLLAEDDEDFFIIFKITLNHAGFTGYLQLVDNDEKLNHISFSGHTPDLIILDLNTSESDWRQALKNVKGAKRLGTVPVVVMAALIDSGDMELCRAYSQCTLMQKPKTLKEWNDTMEEIVRMNSTIKLK